MFRWIALIALCGLCVCSVSRFDVPSLVLAGEGNADQGTPPADGKGGEEIWGAEGTVMNQGVFAPAEPDRRWEKEGLFSKTEEGILKYLEDQTIPYSLHVNTSHGGPTADPARVAAEMRRARELFKKGSPKLRLAIAEALTMSAEDDDLHLYDLWQECGEGDYEAKHHLAGKALLNTAKKEEKNEIRGWLLEESHPSYASIMLADLWAPGSDDSFYDGVSNKDKDRFIPWLRELYRQPGNVFGECIVAGHAYEGLSVQAAVVKLLPRTKAGRDQLLQWMVADSKKIDRSALDAMDRQWSIMDGWMGGGERGESLLDKAFREKAIVQLALAEFCLLTGDPLSFGNASDEEKQIWQKNLWSQVFNPDERVRQAAIRYALSGGEDYLYDWVRGMEAGAACRERTMWEIEAVYQKVENPSAEFRENYRRLIKACEPKMWPALKEQP